jgi:hypothetical protein
MRREAQGLGHLSIRVGMSALRSGLAVCFLHLDDHEAVGLLNDVPAPSSLRLVPRQDCPPAVRVVDLVLLGPRHLDDGDAVDGSALTPPRAKGVHSGFSHARCRTSKTNTAAHRRPAAPCDLQKRDAVAGARRVASCDVRLL